MDKVYIVTQIIPNGGWWVVDTTEKEDDPNYLVFGGNESQCRHMAYLLNLAANVKKYNEAFIEKVKPFSNET